jgi:RNA polymerase sigma factor (sigma-70 family)
LSDVTTILNAIEAGDSEAADQLLPLVYDELRRLARAKMAAERPGQTLQATALVHEAYLRLVGPVDLCSVSSGSESTADAEPSHTDNGRFPSGFANRRHFFAAAAEAMRRILVENARRKGRLKHGGGRERVELGDEPAPEREQDLVALDEALTRLAQEDPQAAKVVELRYFAGLGHEQIADTLEITVYQARQKWTYARAWLRDALAH